LDKLNKEKSDLITQLDKDKGILEEKLLDQKLLNGKLEDEVSTERQSKEDQSNRLAKAEVEFKNLREKLDTQKIEMEELQKKFTTEFENIAHKILKQWKIILIS